MLLAIIAIIAVPSVINQVKKSNEKAYNTQILLIESGAESYAYDHPISDDYGTVLITLKELQDSGYADKNIANPITGEVFDENMQIQITKLNGSYLITTYDNKRPSCTLTDDCAIDYDDPIGLVVRYDPVNGTNDCTSGNTCYTWNVIAYNTANNAFDIMMSSNYGDELYCFNDVAILIQQLYNEWNTPVRLISAEEIANLITGSQNALIKYESSDGSIETAMNLSPVMNDFLVLESGNLGYWTNTVSSGEWTCSAVAFCADLVEWALADHYYNDSRDASWILSDNPVCGYVDMGVNSGDGFGIRPVITVQGVLSIEE